LKEGLTKEGWSFDHEDKDIAVWTKKISNSSVHVVKGVGVINASSTDVLNFLKDVTCRSRYDEMVSEAKVIEVVDEHTQVVYESFKAQQYCRTAQRDFCHLLYWRQLQDGTCVIAGTSVEHPECPVKHKFVRAEVITGGWIIKPSNRSPNRALVTYLMHLDLKGKIPVWIANLVLKSQPLCINAIRSLFK